MLLVVYCILKSNLWPFWARIGCLEKLENNIFWPLDHIDTILILRIEASSNNHPAKVPEAVLPPHNEERLIKVRMIFSQFLLLDFSTSTELGQTPVIFVSMKQQELNECTTYIYFWQKLTLHIILGQCLCEYLFISACSFFSWIILISLSSLCALR